VKLFLVSLMQCENYKYFTVKQFLILTIWFNFQNLLQNLNVFWERLCEYYFTYELEKNATLFFS
jgi:hypothetical protein